MKAPDDAASDDPTALLQRVLSVVEKDDRAQRLEIAAAVLLGLATMVSAWCAYQANLWGGVQMFRIVDSGKASREATQQFLTANQKRSVDIQMLMQFTEAKARGDEKYAKLLDTSFQPEARKVIETWLKTDPLASPGLKTNPFDSADYKQPEMQAAQLADQQAARKMDAAQQANEASDKYVLLTVLSASVLFFGGISGTFNSQRLALKAFVIAAILFVATVAAMITLPICNE